jgi:hypothetical protein
MILEKTFFPSSRKQLLVETITLLKNPAGETRIKLGLAMPFDDGKLVGMPSWVGTAYDSIGKEDSFETTTKFNVELSEMKLFVFTGADSEKPAQTLSNVILKTFSISRGSEAEDAEELSDVSLHFTAYVPATLEAWGWLFRHYRQSIFVRFETTQMDLPLAEKPADPQMTIPTYEEERKAACAKEQDAEFAGKKKLVTQ